MHFKWFYVISLLRNVKKSLPYFMLIGNQVFPQFCWPKIIQYNNNTKSWATGILEAFYRNDMTTCQLHFSGGNHKPNPSSTKIDVD